MVEKMGNIYATNYLTDVANLTLQFTMLSMAFTMILGRQHGTGWVLGPSAIIAYNVMVRIAWNVQNPLQLYVGEDEEQAQVILFFMFTIFCYAYSILGEGFLKVIRAKELFPFARALSPIQRKDSDPVGISVDRTTGDVTLDELEYDDGTGSRAYSTGTGQVPPVRARPTWLHLLAALAYFLVNAAGFIAWDQVILITGDEWIALIVIILDPFVSTLLMWAFCLFYTDPAIFGHTKDSLASHRDTANLSNEEVERIVKKTRSTVTWSIVPIGAFLLIGNTTLGVTRYLDADVDVNWLVAVCLWAVFALLLIICYLVQRSQYNPMKSKCRTKQPIPDGGNFYASPLGKPSTMTNMNTNKAMNANNRLFNLDGIVSRV